MIEYNKNMGTLGPDEWLSYSKFWNYHKSPADFLLRYALGITKVGVEGAGNKLHNLVEAYIKRPKDILRVERKPAKNTAKFDETKVYLSGADLTNAFDSLMLFLERKSSKKFKKAMKKKNCEIEIKNDEIKTRGRLDLMNAEMILDWKFQPLSQIKNDVFIQYGIQCCIYKELCRRQGINVPFYSISISPTSPYACVVYQFTPEWIESIYEYLNQSLIPRYLDYVSKIKKVLGDDVFVRDFFDDKKELLRNIDLCEKKGLLEKVVGLSPPHWIQKDIQIQRQTHL